MEASASISANQSSLPPPSAQQMADEDAVGNESQYMEEPLSDYFPVHPPRADNAMYNHLSSRGRAFLRDKAHANDKLPALLAKGIPYTANFISLEELAESGALSTSSKDAVSITTEELRLLYQAKCIDQDLPPSWKREVRFMELVSANCKGGFFSLPENGLSVASAEAITHILSSNRAYTVLELSGNQLKDEGAEFIATLVRVNRSLVHIGLSSNNIGPAGGITIARALEENNTVVSLDLGARSGVNGNHIGMHGAEAIGHLLEHNAVLSKLNLCSNGLGANGLSYIAKGLSHNVALTHLDLSSNNLGYEGARILASIIECGTISHLAVQRNSLGDKGGRLFFQAITDAMENDTDVLTYVNAEDNGFGPQTAQCIGKVLSTSNALQTLCLSGNAFGKGVKRITDGLGDNKMLTTLQLSRCQLTEDDGAAFGKALGDNKTLRVLDLSSNKLKDRGVVDLLKGVGVNKCLRVLNLSANKIGSDGGQAIGECLLVNSTLRNLNLRRNAMPDATGELLDANLRSNLSLEAMDITYNDFSYKCSVGIKASLERNGKNNQKLIVPMLISEIDELAPTDKALTQVEDEVDMEKRIIKDRSEQLLRRGEEARVITEKVRREVAELQKKLEVVRSSCEACEEELRKTEDKVSSETSLLTLKKTNMETRIQQEKDRADRFARDIERLRKQIRAAEVEEKETFAPLIKEITETDKDRNREREDAKYDAEKLATMELRIKELEIAKKNKRGSKRKSTV